ncbi:MAG: IS481 family transposase, partial [Phycisphaerales bacterium]|nr:IS481 family transposase [Phycisphaerales bacterium]
MSDQRLALVHLVRTVGVGVSQAAGRFGVSRKTAYKWLARHDADPQAALDDRPRTPRRQPLLTPTAVHEQIVRLRGRYGWGARKLHADLLAHGVCVPSVRSVHAALRRAGLVNPPPLPAPPPVRFERDAPNELWQVDFKAFIEADRRRLEHLTVLDDHSRFLLAMRRVPELSMAAAWDVLWGVFAEAGLPLAVLSDNAFGSRRERPRTLSWFDSRLIRPGITPLHGRPYHPQTQGKVERLHGTLERECFPRARRDCPEHFAIDCERWRRLYNNRRPHEAIGDAPPVTRWVPSPRKRPATLPEVSYPPGAVTRRVSTSGDVHFKNYRIVAGKAPAGQYVAVEERDQELLVRYGGHVLRR